MRRLLPIAALCAAASVLLSAAGSRPNLVVILVVDQMRADYIERFESDWSSGLRRLVEEGAWFTRAAYPYLNTFTCAGHATISTGAFPHVHGVFANTWFARDRNTSIACTDDAQARPVTYGTQADGHDGPGALKVPSLGDEIRSSGGHVVTLALKARSAIMLAGHGGDAVTWMSESLDSWETSSIYTTAAVPQVQAFIAQNPVAADFGKTWTRLLPDTQYRDADNGLGEAPIKGWTATFPHPLKGNGTRPDTSYYDQWQHSPFADAYVGRMAAALVESMQLGKHDATDLLAVSFSSPDLVGHAFGPRSQEIEDMYAHLDRTIGDLIDALDRVVGRDHYVLALAADHGVTDIPEQLKQAGRDAGRVSTTGVLNAAEDAAEAALGPGKYFARMNSNDIYMTPGMYDRVRQSPKAMKAIIDALEKQPGVHRAFPADVMAASAHSSDREKRAAALSYVSGRSGDFVIAARPGWVVNNTGGTTHGSPTADDQRVPIVLFGADIKAGRYSDSVTPADVAPTLALLAHIPLPAAEGHPLKEALR